MPRRKGDFYNDMYYHIYDKTIDQIKPFKNGKDINRFLKLLFYYRSEKSTVRLSKLLPEQKKQIINVALHDKNSYRAKVLAFCIMSNHYHFLMKQVKNNGIRLMLSYTLLAFTKYYNIKYNRKGPLFLPQFRAKQIHNEESLLWVSRYIHTNPFNHSVITSPEDLFSYPFSSLKYYMSETTQPYVSTSILNMCKMKINTYRTFILSNVNENRTRDETSYLSSLNI